jgi:ribose 5-phosphate isomerase A
MAEASSQPEEVWKRLAAERALGLVGEGVLLGLGTGSTAVYFVQGLGRMVASGLRVQGVATSAATASLARALGIPLVERLERPIDLAVDGADEIDPALNCIKGRGGALLREKIIAQAAGRFVLIADERKLVPRLGRGPVPVEVLPFLWEETAHRIAQLGGRPQLRGDAAAPFLTDNGNLVLDVSFEEIADPVALAVRLKAIAGVVEHGLFCGMARTAVIGGPDGVRVLGEAIDPAAPAAGGRGR